MPTPVQTMVGKQLLVQIEDPANAGTFISDCLINTDRGVQFSSETTQETVSFCDVPTQPGFTEITIDSLTMTVTGSGKLHTPSVSKWWDWLTSGASKNCRVKLNGVSLANGGGHFAAKLKLTEFEISGGETGKAEASVTLVSDGVVTFVPASA